MSTPSPQEQVRELVRMLREGASPDRHRAAIEIGRLGVRTRGISPTRGRISQAQTTAFPGDYATYLQAARAGFQDADPDVRREVAFAVGEWGDAAAVAILRWIVLPGDSASEPDPGVRTAAVRALGWIGGPEAVEILERVALEDPHQEVRSSAVSALGSLARSEYKAARTQTPTIPPLQPTVRTRGAVRTRGSSPVRSLSAEAQQVLNLLERVRGTDPSWQVRDAADDVLTDLGE